MTPNGSKATNALAELCAGSLMMTRATWWTSMTNFSANYSLVVESCCRERYLTPIRTVASHFLSNSMV